MKKYKAIIYDIDGTLLNTLNMNMYPLMKIIKEETGEDWTFEQVLKFAPYPGMKVMDELGVKDKEKTYARWVQYVNDYEDGATLFEGFEEVLEKFKEKGLQQAIVSSKLREQYEIDVVSKGIDRYMSAVILEDDTTHHKPHPEPLLKCIEKLNLNFYEDNRDYHNIVEILENIAIKLNKYEDINIIFDTDSEEIFVLIDPYNLIKVIARLISIVCKYSNNKALISFDIKQNKDKINIHIYNKNKTKENITENEANVMETAAILCKLVLNLYGGKLEIKQRFNDVNIELQSVNNIDYTIRNGLELIKEDFIEEEFQKIYNL